MAQIRVEIEVSDVTAEMSTRTLIKWVDGKDVHTVANNFRDLLNTYSAPEDLPDGD